MITQIARALGWFSIALGAFEILAPGQFARAIGIHERSGIVRSFGVREVATGLGILASPGRPAGLWARLGGDALDLAVIRASARKGGRQRAALATIMVAGVALIDAASARRLHRRATSVEPVTPRARRSQSGEGSA